MSNGLKIALVLVLAVSVSACRTSKTTLSTNGELSDKAQTEVLNDVISKELKYRTINGKMSLELKSGSSSKKVGGFVKMIRDSVIQISIRPILGIEVARITITPDSIYFLDRLNKKYAIESTQNLQKAVNFNYYNLQALVTNSLFVAGKKSVSKSDFKNFSISSSSDNYLASTQDAAGVIYAFVIDATDNITATSISDKNNNSLYWTYKEFVKDGSYIYPTEMNAKIEAKNKRVDVGLSYSKLTFDEQLDIDYSVSSKYHKITFGDILKAYL